MNATADYSQLATGCTLHVWLRARSCFLALVPANAGTGWPQSTPPRVGKLSDYGTSACIMLSECARPRGSLRRGLCRTRLACAHATLRSPHGGRARRGQALDPREEHVEQALTLAAATLGLVETSRHLGARTLGIEMAPPLYPLFDRRHNRLLHLEDRRADK